MFLKRGLILCEGETEENYFKGIVTEDKHRRKFASIDVKIYKPKDHSPKGLVDEAKNRISEAESIKDPYDFVWVVFDKDGHANVPQAFNEARASRPSIDIAFTVRCFEYYVLLHFEKTTGAFVNCDEVITRLKRYSPDYEKASNLFRELEQQMSTGLENSEWCLNQCENDLRRGRQPYDLSAYSNIHELVNFLYTLVE
ncbi:MAG: RloB domain-containing protein [Flavobacteriales bacterium]|nr:RloB domain-containing protein [Flavobacteriales bacterium]